MIQSNISWYTKHTSFYNYVQTCLPKRIDLEKLVTYRHATEYRTVSDLIVTIDQQFSQTIFQK